MKKLILVLCAVSLATTGAWAALEGTDNAADSTYSDGWTTGDNGGTIGSFLPWDLTNTGGGGFSGYFIGDSTAGSGNLNTGGVSFGIFANPGGAFADANRSFATPLLLAQTFSLDLGVDFRNGNKGFSLFQGATEIFNLNVGSNDYQVNGVSLGLGFIPDAVFSLSFTQTSLTGGTYLVSVGANQFTATYTGVASGFKLYNSDTDSGDPANNLYFNNLSIVPEPSSLALLAGPALLAAWFTVRRRRRA